MPARCLLLRKPKRGQLRNERSNSIALSKNNIAFSSDNGKISRGDLDETSKISEEHFGMDKDPNQMPATTENKDWIYRNIQDYLNIIRYKSKIIVYAFLLPCNRILMDSFVKKRISEATLVKNIKKMKLTEIPEAIYLCASVIREDFRGRGLATSAFVKAINKITHSRKEKPALFCWEYSEEGGKLARRVADKTSLKLRIRK